jgi:hypothetical protein
MPTADDLRRAERKDIEGRLFGPLGEDVSRVLLELIAAKVEVNDLAPVEFTER